MDKVVKKSFLCLLLLIIGCPYGLFSQYRRLLSLEEAVMGYGIRVENRNYVWQDGKSVYTCAYEDVITGTDARTGRTDTLITIGQINSLTGMYLNSIPNYSWNGSELVMSARGVDFAIDLNGNKLSYMCERPEDAMNSVFLGEGAYVFTRDNNIYYVDSLSEERTVTCYEDRNIVCGSSVSRNEFGITKGLFPSPQNDKIAFYRKDESAVTSFPLLDITTRTGSLLEVKYPMNGMPSEKVAVGVYDVSTEKVVWLEADDFDEERYLTNITWDPSGELIYVQVLDRAQKNMHLNVYDASTGEYVKTLLTEHNDKFVEPQNELYFIEGDSDKFIYTTDNRDGYYNLYLCSVSDGSVERLTDTDADVSFVAQRGDYVYYYSAEVSPVENHLFRVNMETGKSERITMQEGWHRCSVSHDGRYVIDSYSSMNVPFVVELYDLRKGGNNQIIFKADNPCESLNYTEITLGTIKSADGRFDNYYRLIKPLDFDPSKKYPVIVYVYGGPHSQLVTNSFQAALRPWEMFMAQNGYVVFVMDNRGTSNRGAEFEKATHGMLGKCEMEDQLKGIEWLTSHSWVDKERIGVHGWSYGGFMTISLMTNYPDVFKVGVAGGPVIDWKWYEVMYGERYMETEATNPEGFRLTSLIPMAPRLKGRLLICQGAIDDTVLWQHSLNFVEACIKNGIQLDYFPYPTYKHNVSGTDRIHLMRKVSDYFDEFLK